MDVNLKLKPNKWTQKQKNEVQVYINEDIYITVPKRKKKKISATINYDGPIVAPIEKDAKLGELNIFLNDNLVSKHDVFSSEKIKRVNIFSRIFKSFNFLGWGDV